MVKNSQNEKSGNNSCISKKIRKKQKEIEALGVTIFEINKYFGEIGFKDKFGEVISFNSVTIQLEKSNIKNMILDNKDNFIRNY